MIFKPGRDGEPVPWQPCVDRGKPKKGITMLDILIAIYRANPFRPHCSAAHHVWLCTFLGMQRPGRQCNDPRNP